MSVSLDKQAMNWRDPASAPKHIVLKYGPNWYGPYILVTTTRGDVRRVRWWQYEDDEAGNFLGDCGIPFRITAWMPLPEPFAWPK